MQIASRTQVARGATPARRADAIVLAVLLVYVAIVHSVDTLAAWGSHWLIDWSVFRWSTASGFDLYKFFAWLVVPFVYLLVLGRIDWGYFGVKRWRRVDGLILAGLVAAGLLAVLSILVFPGLQHWYPGWGGLPTSERWHLAAWQLTWTFSWIIGWEFIHRYALLTQLTRVWPRYGWLAVPLIEGLYHVQKDWHEMLAMVAFSLVLTPWALARRNVVLPFLAHFAVEAELIGFLMVSGPR